MSGLNCLKKTKKQLMQELQHFFYKKAIHLINRIEKERSQTNQKQNTLAIICVSFVIIWLIIISQSIVAGIFSLIIALFIFVLSVPFMKDSAEIKDYDTLLKAKLMQDFLAIFGDFEWNKKEPFLENYSLILHELKKLKIVPSFLLYLFDDVIEGTYNDIYLKITEIRVGAKAVHAGVFFIYLSFVVLFLVVAFMPLFAIFSFIKEIQIPQDMLMDMLKPVFFLVFFAVLPMLILIVYLILSKSFKAIIVEFDIPKHFSGNTCVFEKSLNSKKLINKKISDMEEVNLEDVKFNMLYDIYSTDQIEARYLLTTAFIDRFLMIKTVFKAKYIRAEFSNDKLTLLIGTDKDLFSMGKLSEKIAFNTFVQLFEELYSVLELIDTLKLNQKTGL